MSNNATRHARPAADDAATQAARAARSEKMAWVKAVGADAGLSSSAARVAMTAAINLAYNKGCIRATRRHLGKLSGLSDATVKRAITELSEQYYWEIDHTSGGANLYTLITPNERLKLWLEEESNRKQEMQRWLSAERRATEKWLYTEKQFIQKWLDTEKRFVREWLDAEQLAWCNAEIDARHDYERAVFNAVLDRCGNTGHAMSVANATWVMHQRGSLPLQEALETIAQRPQELFPDADPDPGSGHLSTGVGSPVHRGRVNSDSLTSENRPSTSTYKSDKLEVSTSNASPTGRAPTGAPSGDASTDEPQPQHRPVVDAETCPLCDDRGKFIDGSDDRGRLLYEMFDAKTGGRYALNIECQHSLEANLAKIQRLEVGGKWEATKSGWKLIDDYFEFTDDEDVYDETGRIILADEDEYEYIG